MQRDLGNLSNEPLDLLVIGGGIFGAGIARGAALRGLKVALVERADFASGTSSRSSKLIHGGFRYLEQRAFGLVAESSRERRILQEIAPHRVHPLPLLLPVYEGDPRPLWLMRVGMTLYDVLAMFGNTGRHRSLSPDEATEYEPGLARPGLRGAIRFFDCQEDDARFCVDNILHARQLGAACANYCEVTGFIAETDRISRARVKDHLGGDEFEIRARAFVNAAGPWVERVAGFAPALVGDRPNLSPTQGVHILLPAVARGHGLFFQARRDGRMMFILPRNDCTLAGTTDTDFAGDPADVRAGPDDINYLLDEVRAIFPDSGFTEADVITTIAGIRPLLKSESASPSARSREHRLLHFGNNFLSIAGGKYTTYRLIAAQAVDEVYAMLGKRAPRCRTAEVVIPDPRPPALGKRLSQYPAIFEGDVIHAVREEMAASVEDVMWRRTGLMLSQSGGREIAEAVGRLMSPVIGWTDEEASESVGAYMRGRSGRASGRKDGFP